MNKWTDARARAVMAARMGGVKYDTLCDPRKRKWFLNDEDVTEEIQWAINTGELKFNAFWLYEHDNMFE